MHFHDKSVPKSTATTGLLHTVTLLDKLRPITALPQRKLLQWLKRRPCGLLAITFMLYSVIEVAAEWHEPMVLPEWELTKNSCRLNILWFTIGIRSKSWSESYAWPTPPPLIYTDNSVGRGGSWKQLRHFSSNPRQYKHWPVGLQQRITQPSSDNKQLDPRVVQPADIPPLHWIIQKHTHTPHTHYHRNNNSTV